MRVVILGAAGRDFHNFNTVFRDNPSSIVVAFTATQIPGIANRIYPPSLAGPHYPAGIPIVAEDRIEELCRAEHIDQVVFAYSDVPHEHVMHLASRVLAVGADFLLLGPRRTMLTTSRPAIAVSGLRTGCGKSPISRWLAQYLRHRGRRVVVIRHPMPYGNLAMEKVQRFAAVADLAAAHCTIEEARNSNPTSRAAILFSRNSLGRRSGYATRMSANRRVGLEVKVCSIFQPCFLAVERTVRMTAKSFALHSDRNPPEIFWRSFIIRPSRSARLLVKGTMGSVRNRSTSSRRVLRRSSRL